MTGKELFREIGNIDEKYVAEAEMAKRSVIMSPVFRRTLATAACLVVCLGIYFSVKQPDFAAKSESASISADSAETSMKTETAIMDSASEGAMTDEGASDSFWEDIWPQENATQTVPEAREEVYMETETSESDSVITQDSTDLKQESVSLGTTQGSATVEMTDMRDAESVCKRFAQYGDSVEELTEEVAVVNVHGYLESGMEALESFMAKTGNGEEASIELVQFTIEGDPIFYYIHYNGTDFYMVKDDSRDAFAGNSAMVQEYEYKYLQKYEETLTDGTCQVVMVLTNREDLTLTEVKKGAQDCFLFMQYTKE